MLKLCNQIYSSCYKTIMKLHMYIIPSHYSKTASFLDHVSNMSYINNLYYSYNSVLVILSKGIIICLITLLSYTGSLEIRRTSSL